MNPILTFILEPFYPLHQTVRRYTRRKFRSDLLAGLTVAVLEVPQAMAYALIAGVPPQYGLYTSVVQGALGALLASNNHLASGPTNTQSLLIAATVSRAAQQLGYDDPALYLQLVFGLTLLKGLVQLAFAAARMGNLVRYVSQSVIVGFSAGAGVLIAMGQLPSFLGIRHDGPPSTWPGILGQLQNLLPHLSEINGYAVAIGVGSLALMLVLRKISRLIPGPLLAVVLSAAAVVLLGWDAQQVALVGPMPSNLPRFTVPPLGWREAELLLSGALALALLGMIETVAIGKTIASQTGEKVWPNREFFAQGVANFVGAFIQNIPGSGSFTRSALNFTAGGQTRMAGVFNACFVAVILLALGKQAQYIPLASLAAVLFVVAYSLIDWRYLYRVLRTNRSDSTVAMVTFVATLLAPLQYAIYIGVFLNIALYLRHASQLHIAEMVHSGAGPFIERPIQDRAGNKQVIFLQLEGDLFFGVADELQDRLTDMASQGVRVIILRLKRTHWIDATVLSVLERFARDFSDRRGHVVLCGVKPELMATLRSFGLVDTLGAQNIFEAGFGVFTSAKRALRRARELVGSSIDTQNLNDLAEETEGWAYEI